MWNGGALRNRMASGNFKNGRKRTFCYEKCCFDADASNLTWNVDDAAIT